MRHAKSGLRLSARTFLGVVLVGALVAPAWGYINGGDFHSTLKTFENSLKDKGWSVSFGAAIPADRDDVNQLVGRALKALPEKDASKVSVEAKREVARLAREAIQQAASKKEQTIKEGQTGSLRYQVGVYHYESYWETNYGGKREIHERRSRRAPFVALRIVDAKEPAQQQP
jgi:hypothetical protein